MPRSVFAAESRPGEDRRTVILLLAAVLSVAFGVRLWMALSLPRFFDDHYVFNNITSFLNGSLRPRHSYYGSLAHLPQSIALAFCDWLHSLTGIGALAVRGTQFEGLTLSAFRITRMFGIAYSLVSIAMIYLVGRRLFSPRVGVLAAAVLAAYAQHVRSAIQLKPDMLALMFTLIALYWTAGAAREPRLSRFLLCGVGVGLATSAKYIGLASALPVAAWGVWTGFRDRRRWAWLVLAGVTSVITFFILNPFFGQVFHFAVRLTGFYAGRGRAAGSDHLVVLRRELETMASQHGVILGFFLLLGTALLLRQLWRRPENEPRAAALLPLSLFLGYLVIHAAGVTQFYSHNLLPAMGGTALVCAYGIDRSWQRLIGSRATLRKPGVPILIWLLIGGGFLLVRPFHYAYSQIVPGTWVVAEKILRERLAPLRIRQLVHEPLQAQLELRDGWQYAARTEVPSLASVSTAVLDLTDAELFPLSRIEEPQAGFYEDRRQRLPQECFLEIRPRPFSSRGTPLGLLLHPWTPAGQALPLNVQCSGSPTFLVANLPADLIAGEVLSLDLLSPAKRLATAVMLQPGNQRLALHYAGRRQRRTRFVTPRLRWSAGAAEIHILVPAGASPKNFRLQLWRWTRAACS